MATTELTGFYKLSSSERRAKVAELAKLSEEEVKLLADSENLSSDVARMVENHIGNMLVPIGIATGFIINKKEYLIPMAIEEPSVIAAACNAAKLAGESGGFLTSSTEPVMIGQVQLVGVKDAEHAVNSIHRGKKELIDLANKQDEMLVNRGGGARDVEARALETNRGTMVIVHLLVDVRDAMGANAINTMAEAISPRLAELSGGKVRLRIISNLAVHRIARARAVFKKEIIGEDVVEGICDAYAFAAADPYRCATHNKGVMNGIDAVALATGNDWRAVEAGAHAYAALKGYKPLTHWEKDKGGNLVGAIELPITVGIVGGATRTHPIARIALKVLGVKEARELAEVMAAVGLAQNFAALKALSTEGIQRGHMKLHARNIAILSGAEGNEVDIVTEELKKGGKISADRARGVLKELRGKK